MKNLMGSSLRSFAAGAMIGLSLIPLAACTPEVKEGVVVKKNFTPAHDESRQGACIVYQKIGSSQICTVYSQYDEHIDDKYSVTLANPKGDRSSWDVSKGVYEDTKVGQKMSLDGK